jgi:hypothetical protein
VREGLLTLSKQESLDNTKLIKHAMTGQQGVLEPHRTREMPNDNITYKLDTGQTPEKRMTYLISRTRSKSTIFYTDGSSETIQVITQTRSRCSAQGT